MKRLLWGAMIVAAVAMGCSGHGRPVPAFRSPLESTGALLLRTGSVEEMQRVLDRRAATYDTLVAQGRVTLRMDAQGGRRWFEANMLWRREPTAIRLRGSRVGPGTLFEMLSTGDEAWFYLSGERTLYLGSPDQLTEQAGVLGALGLEEMMSALLVSQDLRAALAGERWRLKVTATDHEIAITRPYATGGDKTWIVRRADAFVREVRLRDDDGATIARVRYDEYAFAQPGAPMPTDLTIMLPMEGLEARFEASTWKLNPTLKDIVFDRPRGAKTTLPLAELGYAAPIDLEEDPGAPAPQ